MSNEGDTGLLKYDTIEDCWRFLVVNLLFNLLCLILGTLGCESGIPFLSNTF